MRARYLLNEKRKKTHWQWDCRTVLRDVLPTGGCRAGHLTSSQPANIVLWSTLRSVVRIMRTWAWSLYSVTVQHSPALVSPLSTVTGENSSNGVSALRAILLAEALGDLQIFYHN